MTVKEWLKRFRWGVFVPAALYFVIGVMTAAMYPRTTFGTAWPAYEFTVASLALIAGACTVADYFLGRDDTLMLLSGVGSVSVAIYLFVPSLAQRGVVPIALGISLVLHAAAMFYGGLRMRKEERAEFIARVVLASAFAVLGVLSCVFTGVNVLSARGDWVLAGVSYLAYAICSFVFAWRGGLLEKEETLKFRPVKKQEPAEKEEPETAEEEEEDPADGAPPRRGAHRR